MRRSKPPRPARCQLNARCPGCGPAHGGCSVRWGSRCYLGQKGQPPVLAECPGSKRRCLGSGRKGASRPQRTRGHPSAVPLATVAHSSPRVPSPYPAGPGPGPRKSPWKVLPRGFPRPRIVLTVPRRWSTLTARSKEDRGETVSFPKVLKDIFRSTATFTSH